MSISEAKITEDMKAAMKAKDKVALTTLRALKAAFKNAAIDKAGPDGVLDEGEMTAIIRKQIKQRLDSISQFEANDRPDLAETEKLELAVLEGYLPAALSAEEVEAIVTDAIAEVGATGKQDMGKVMKAAQEKSAGRADGKVLSQMVMQKLNQL
ncbi:GatB/YqeY domain-containing protein [Persicirhabdus sediminis]|uniref:GatB/YqeY domain-containing protein n=1 Tax=Persicirhabdus sediminis TaxID=454144 RepID=A0A8J7SFU9_9BACT|nr:GatB/YqeY domain-containing protein [Persicirhabdus sediminis]MBK1789705.1 GatB/YqeY domain-containing protein [Persicirhabdus sediminis]